MVEIDFDFTEALANSLRAERNRRRMTMEQLANAAGVSRDSIWKWENGEVAMSFQSAYTLSKVLGCPLEDLVKH